MNEELMTHHLSELKTMFGDLLPDPHHYPLQFEYYLKLYWFYLKRSENIGALVPNE